MKSEEDISSFTARSPPRSSRTTFPAPRASAWNEQAAQSEYSGDRVLAAADLVNIDVSAELGGFTFADTGGSFIIPPVSSLKRNLLRRDQACALELAINREARVGRPLNGIGRAIGNSRAEKTT